MNDRDFYQRYKQFAKQLSLQEEHQLAKAIKQAQLEQKKEKPDPSLLQAGNEAREVLILSNIRLVMKVVVQFDNLQSLTEVDLLQEGIIGLIKAVDTFDPRKNPRFSTYAVWVIKNTTINAIFEKDRLIHLPPYVENQIRDLIRQRGGETQEQILRMRTLLSLDLVASSTEGEDEDATLGQSLSDSEGDFAEILSTKLVLEESARMALSPQERQIANDLFIRDIVGAEVARQTGVSKMRIIQRKQAIIEKLRKQLHDMGITADLFD